eukprot:760827-Amphidinium_carterae.1
MAFESFHSWSNLVSNVTCRIRNALLGIRSFVSATVFSSKLEQKPSARPIYAGDVELRQLLRMFATSATGLAKRCISTAATYDVEQMWTLRDSTLRSTAEGTKTRVSRFISCDISGWSPHFQRARHIRRVVAVSDMTHRRLPRLSIAAALQEMNILFRYDVIRDSVDQGSAVEGYPMGWSPSADSLIHAS